MSLNRKQLATASNFRIESVQINEATHAIQVIDTRDNSVCVDLHLDPMDNTLAGTISAASINKMGDTAKSVLELLSKAVQENIGAKEFIFVPASTSFQDFTPAQDHGFKRMRHANRSIVSEETQKVLDAHAELTASLDSEFEFIVGASNARNTIFKLNEMVFDLFVNHANFTEEKLAEYKSEGTQGVKARLNNGNVDAIFLKSRAGKLVGMMRALAMGDNACYLSDEIVMQDIVALEHFEGSSAQEKALNRGIFLLSYLANRLSAKLTQYDSLVIIAASGREGIYESIGFKAFPIPASDYNLVIKLAPPCALLNSIKSQLIRTDNVAAIKQFSGILSTDKPAASISPVTAQTPRFGN